MQRIERLRVVELVRRNVALAERGHSQVDERVRQGSAAEAAHMPCCHAVPPLTAVVRQFIVNYLNGYANLADYERPENHWRCSLLELSVVPGRRSWQVAEQSCRACAGGVGDLVLDLGEQPACDYFPGNDVVGPDPVYPLRMWLCSRCGLAQLAGDPTVPEEPRGTEPAALVSQAAEAVRRVRAAGLLPSGGRVTEYGSP